MEDIFILFEFTWRSFAFLYIHIIVCCWSHENFKLFWIDLGKWENQNRQTNKETCLLSRLGTNFCFVFVLFCFVLFCFLFCFVLCLFVCFWFCFVFCITPNYNVILEEIFHKAPWKCHSHKILHTLFAFLEAEDQNPFLWFSQQLLIIAAICYSRSISCIISLKKKYTFMGLSSVHYEIWSKQYQHYCLENPKWRIVIEFVSHTCSCNSYLGRNQPWNFLKQTISEKASHRWA